MSLLPHITNSKAGRGKWEPLWKGLYQMYFTVPPAIAAKYSTDDILTLSEQITTVSGLNAVDKGPDKSEQKFFGSTRTYVNPKIDGTSMELTCKFNLNLRDRTDNFIYKIFYDWKSLNYDLNTGESSLKEDACADYFRIVEHNKAGDIIRDIKAKDVMLFGELDSSIGDLDNSSNDMAELTVKFVSDCWDDTRA